MAPLDHLVARAFAAHGPSLLWNLREPMPPVAARTARAIGRRLTREGGAEAVRLGWDILDEVEKADARPLPGGGAGLHRAESVGR